ncbi:hypothetical protein BJX63DRAFT_430923 [Aspergillus granulosus]|uniref:FAD linked oxidase N-terminal domain-containing protein n=1 Tax=Aspergillus granulosus TaxID=176169 RepID=A0ABR4HHY5_9EURO
MAPTSPSSELPSTPLLSDNVHSGIPKNLEADAKVAKERLYSNKTFEAAIAELRERLGAEHVQLNDKPLVDGWYMEHPNTHDAFHIAQQELVCSAVVYPSSTEEAQAIVFWANRHTIPTYPISIVLKIDGSNASRMVEPGVSYYKLYEEIQKTGYPLWIDCPNLGRGSVMGNELARRVGYTPYGDHFANHCGMEIVLPTGELLQTGMGALPGKDGADNPVREPFQPACGPYSDGIFSQSNFGIVTKMGFWLMPATSNFSYMVTFPQDNDFEQIIEVIRPLAQRGVFGNIPQLRHVIQELAVTGKPKITW